MRSLFCLPLLLSAASAWAGGSVGWVHPSSQLHVGTRPAQFTALNLLDGKDATVWCEGSDGDGVGERVAVGFRGEASFDEVRIVTGDPRDDASFRQHHRVREIEIRSDTAIHRFGLIDSHKSQSFKFDKPVVTERLVLEIAAIERGTGDDNSACIADVIFVSKGKALNGPFLADKLKYNRGRARLMNTWYAGPERARDRFLDFYYDGKFRYAFRPFDPEVKPVTLTGEYAFDGSTVRFKMPGKGWVDSGAAPQDGEEAAHLDIEAKALEKTLAGHWSDKR